MTKAALSFKSRGTEKFKLFFRETDDSINLRYETLFKFDYKCKILVLLSWM